MSIKRSVAPLDDGLDEDTDLPPPAPGMRSPIAEHAFDPPTLPGIVAPHRMAPLRDPPAEAMQAELLATAEHDPLPAEPTLRMSTEALHAQLFASLPEQPGPSELEAAAALPPPPLDPTPVAALIEPESATLSGLRHVHSQTTLTLPEVGQLPPLPPSPEYDSLLAGLRYTRTVFRSLRKRRRLQEQLRKNERADLDALGRVLSRLGQRAYSDNLDMLDWHPLFSGGLPAEPRAGGSPELLRQRAEMAAARLQALAQRELAALNKNEALLASELRQHGQVLRHRYSDLLALGRRARGLPAGHPLHFQRQAAELAVSQTISDVDAIAQRLGQARAERLTQELIYTHAQPPLDQLTVALSARLAAAQRRPPHLQVLGALLATAGIGITPTSTQAATYAAIWQRLAELRGNLSLRQTLFARLELDRQTYDRDAITRTALSLLVLLAAALCSAALVFWMLR
jgi:hypothetical protein